MTNYKLTASYKVQIIWQKEFGMAYFVHLLN